jgi:hypothetical protein
MNANTLIVAPLASALSRAVAIIMFLVIGSVAYAEPIGSSFVYQGLVSESGVPVEGACDFRFRLWNAQAGGVPIGPQLAAGGVPTSAGRFAVELDFGSAFAAETRWLEVSVRRVGGPDFVILTPRQRVSPAPVALFALASPPPPRGQLAFSGSGEFVVPEGVSQVTVELWGAGGGGRYRPDGFGIYAGGSGAYVRSTIPVTPGQRICVDIPGITAQDADGGDAVVRICDSPQSILARAGGGSAPDPVSFSAAGGVAFAPNGGVSMNGLGTVRQDQVCPPPMPAPRISVLDFFGSSKPLECGGSYGTDFEIGGQGYAILSW